MEAIEIKNLANKRARWYVVTTQSGQEKSVAENIITRINSMNQQNKIFDAIVVEEEVPVLKKGEPTGETKTKNKYPRFIFVLMEMDDDSWFVVRNTPGVTGIVGSSGKGTKPTPVPDKEMSRILRMAGRYVDDCIYSVKDEVKIVKGVYQGQRGVVIEVFKDTNQVKVELLMMGTLASMTFPYEDVEKLTY